MSDRGAISGRAEIFFSLPPRPHRLWAPFPEGRGAGAWSWLLTSI